jgi:hypothetical protein
MRMISKSAVIALVAAASLLAMPVSYAGPLSNLVDNVNDVVKSTTGGVEDTVNSLTGGNSSGLDVDLDLGSNDSDNTILDLDADLGTTSASATVTGGNGQGGLLNSGGLLGTGLLDDDDDGGLLGSGLLGSNLTAGLNLGGLQLDLTIPGIDDLLGGGGGGGGGNGGGGNGGNGPGGAGGDGSVRVSSLGDFAVQCSVNQGRGVLELATKARFTRSSPADWRRASGVQIVPVKLCPAARLQVTQIFNASGKIQSLHQAVAGDMLIMASLQRAGRDAGDVFAVQRNGSQLIVYVL